MTVEQTKTRILEDDQFVLAEVKKLQNAYKLKHEIRYDQSRELCDLTESVAEHTWGMQVVADYFLLLEDSERELDQDRIRQMITWHDIDEIITGDIVSYKKQTEVEQDVPALQREAKEKLPDLLHPYLDSIFTECNEKVSKEVKFLKAIDKIEGQIQMYQSGYPEILHSFGRAASHSHAVVGKHVADYPFINRFYQVLEARMIAEGFFVAE